MSVDIQGRLALLDLQLSPASHAELVERLQRAAKENASTLNARIEELRSLLQRFSPVHVISQLTITRTSRPADAVPEEPTFGDEARIEYISGLALSLEQPGTELAGPAEVGDIWSRACGIIDDAQALLRTNSVPADSDPRVAEAQFLFRMEHLLDRMHGYPQHLERLAYQVFEPLRDRCLHDLGFCPGDLVKIVNAMVELARQRVMLSFSEADAMLSNDPPSDQQWAAIGDRDRRMQILSWKLFRAGVESLLFRPEELARATGLPVQETEKALDAYACSWGCQPTFRLPWENNSLRSRPVVRLEGAYFVPQPWALLGELTSTSGFLSPIRERGLSDLEAAFLKGRAAATVALTAQTFASIFGADVVRTELQYESDGKQGDVDCLVEARDLVLTVECKAHRMHEEARRGLAASIKTKIKELVRKPTEQTARSAEYIRQGGRSFRTRSGEEVRINADADVAALRIVVSFERIDPFAAKAAALSDAATEPQWVICLGDLMMVADVLSEPERFLHYAGVRARLAVQSRFMAFSEADVLGAYLVDGLEEVRSALEQHPDRDVVLGFHAGALNARFLRGLLPEAAADPPGSERRPL